MTNNPRKLAALDNMGITVEEHIGSVSISDPFNKNYFSTKARKFGHILPLIEGN